MGIWGTAIFSDDEACDVRDTYRDLLGDGVADDDAERRVLDEFRDQDGDIGPVVWLALAATQSKVGRLTPATRERALDVIDGGADLAAWADSPPADRRRREAAVARLRAQLVGPQPERRKVRTEWNYRTDLTAGDVLASTLADGRLALLRVVRVKHDRFSDFVLVELLAHDGGTVSTDEVASLPRAIEQTTGRPCRWSVAKNHRGELDWDGAGFVRVGSTPSRPADDEAVSGEDADQALLAVIASHGAAGAELVGPGPLALVHGRPRFCVWEQLPAALAAVPT